MGLATNSRRGDDDTGLLSISPLESSSTSASTCSILDKPPPHLLADWQPATIAPMEASNAAEDQALDASLRWAGLQAALEAFKARHPTLPLGETSAWIQGNQPTHQSFWPDLSNLLALFIC